MNATPVHGTEPGALADAHALLREHPAIDLHTDTIMRVLGGTDAFADVARGMHAGPPMLAAGGFGAAVYAFWIPAHLGPQRGWSKVLEMFRALERVRAACSRELAGLDLYPALEDGRVLYGDGSRETMSERVHALAEMGAVYVTLTWNTGNWWATSCEDTRHGVGLTARGRELVARLDEAGIRVDVSHLSDAAILDALDVARHPPIASHSSARALCRHPRNVSDDVARRLADRGGVVGVNVHRPFITEAPGDATIEGVVEHVEHLWRVAGEEAVALGTDFDGIPAGPRGFESARDLPHLVARLLANGHATSRVARLVGGNARERVFRAGTGGPRGEIPA